MQQRASHHLVLAPALKVVEGLTLAGEIKCIEFVAGKLGDLQTHDQDALREERFHHHGIARHGGLQRRLRNRQGALVMPEIGFAPCEIGSRQNDARVAFNRLARERTRSDHVARDDRIVSHAVAGPRPFARVASVDDRLKDRVGFSHAAVAGKPGCVAIRLRAAIDAPRHLIDERVDIRLVSPENGCTFAIHTCGKGDAGRYAIDISSDVRFVTQPLMQGAIELTDRHASVGNLYLDVVAPIVGIARGTARRNGLSLKV